MSDVRVVTSILLVLVLAAAAPAAAQVTTSSPPLAAERAACTLIPSSQRLEVPAGAVCGCYASTDPSKAQICARPQEELTRLVDHDTTEHLLAYLRRLTTAAKVATDGRFVRFVWAGPDAEGKRVARSVVFDPDGNQPTLVLPGVTASASTLLASRRYVDVLVGFDGGIEATPNADLPSLETLYTSGEKPNPILEQLPSFIKQLGLLEAIAAGQGVTTLSGRGIAPMSRRHSRPAPSVARMPEAVFKIYGPTLSHARADIAVRDWIVTKPTEEGIADGAIELRDALKATSARSSACARTLADAQAAALTAAAGCAVPVTSLFGAEADRCRGTLNAALDTAYSGVVGTCPPEIAFPGGDPVAVVDEAFRGVAKGLGASVAQGELALKNVPREHFSFGLMTAVRFGDVRSARPRVKMGDDNLVASDPLPRLLTAVLVNWHPWGYDVEKINTSRDKGSFKLSGGTTVTPDFGLIGTAGYSPLKGLTVHVGYAVLLSNSPKTNVEIGKPVPDDLKDDPFRSVRVGTWLWGLSYSFQ